MNEFELYILVLERLGFVFERRLDSSTHHFLYSKKIFENKHVGALQAHVYDFISIGHEN